jgi:predicted dehydrogenase
VKLKELIATGKLGEVLSIPNSSDFRE